MNPVAPPLMLAFWMLSACIPAAPAERSLDQQVEIAATLDQAWEAWTTREGIVSFMGDGGEWDKAYAYFDRAWSTVLGNLKKRFEAGPQDWTEWLAQLRKLHEEPAKKP